MRRRLSRFQEEVEKHRRKIWILVAVFVLVIAAVGIGLAVALTSNQAVANSANGPATKAPNDAEGANSNSDSDSNSNSDSAVSGKAPCDPATTVVERERLMHPGMAQCSFVYLSKYPSVKLQATDGRYLGTGAAGPVGPAGPAGPAGPGSSVMLVGAESAGVWRFVTTADPLKYQLFLVGGPAGPSGASGASAVGVDGSGALVLSQIPANFVVTGVPDRYMIVFHGVGAAGASGSLRLTVPSGPAAPPGPAGPAALKAPAGLTVPEGLKALSGMDHESIAFNVMDDKWAVVGIYVDPQTVKVFEESKDEAAKLRALRASCCTRFGGLSRPAAQAGPMAQTAQGSCLEESDNVLKPMCCTECVDKLADCATRALYDAGPLINREQCCASIQKLGVQRVYGDTECAVKQSECKGQSIDQTLIDVGNAKVYVPSFGEIAVARFLCGQLYFV